MKTCARCKELLLALLSGMWLLFGCHNNPIGSGGSIWTQGVGVDHVNHFYASGRNLLTSTYCSLCLEAAIFISRDEGLTWNLDTVFHVDNTHNTGPIRDPLYLPAPITFISDGEYLIAGIGYVYKGDVYRSSDDGITWSDSGITWGRDSVKEDIYCFSLLQGKIFAGTDDGVYVSTDHGMRWNPTNEGIPKILIGSHLPVEGLVAIGNSIFASTNGDGIYRSTNGGASWTEVNTTNYDFQSLATVGSEVFAASFNDIGNPSTGGVFVSKDNGNTWQRADADLPDHGANAICASGPNLFVGTNASIYFSSNGGSNWINISAGSPIDGDGATTLYVNDSYLFTDGGGGVWRYPLFLLPGISGTVENYVSQK